MLRPLVVSRFQSGPLPKASFPVSTWKCTQSGAIWRGVACGVHLDKQAGSRIGQCSVVSGPAYCVTTRELLGALAVCDRSTGLSPCLNVEIEVESSIRPIVRPSHRIVGYVRCQNWQRLTSLKRLAAGG